jgi:hypothetical protein
VIIYYATDKKWIMTKSSTIVFFTITLAVGNAIAISIISGTSLVFANHDFAAYLTGQEEVPPVNTQAIGEAIFDPIIPGNETIGFYVNSTGIQGVTAGHIHNGTQGENGDIIVTLFTFNPGQNGVFVNGTIAANILEGPMQGKTVGDLIDAVKSNNTYVNLHTEQNPSGEIRGQLMSTK